MRYGIISDIHGNLEALEAALETLNGCDRWICLGDVVGYGPNPNECCEQVRALDALCVYGNHDLAALGHYDLAWFNEWAGAAILWTQEELTPENKSFLSQMDSVRIVRDPTSGTDFTLVHGSLREPAEEYIVSHHDALATFALMSTSWCLIGHTHVAEYYAKPNGVPACERVSMKSGGLIPLEDGHQYIINCGSVGQPRDRNPQASCGLLDAEARSLEIYRVDYAIETTQQKMLAEGLPDFLWQRLELGM